MYLEVKSTKTFSEYVNEHHNLYSGVHSYVFNVDTNEWEQTAFSSVTKALIHDWFDRRKVCSDEDFGVFFKRVLNNTALRYAQLERIELSSFDPLVADYIEKQTSGNSSKVLSGSENGQTVGADSKNVTNNGSRTEERTPDLTDTLQGERTPNITRTENGTKTPNLTEEYSNTKTPDLTETVNGSGSGTSNTTHGGSDSTTHTGTNSSTDTVTGTTSGETITKDANKQAPQSISYQGQGGGSGAGEYGRLPGLDWQYMTAQAQRDNASEEERTDTTTHSGNDSGSDSTTYGKTESGSTSNTSSETRAKTGHETEIGEKTQTGSETHVNSSQETGRENTSNTERHTGTETTTIIDTSGQTVSGSSNETTNKTTSGSESGFVEGKEIATGRSGLTPQAAFSEAVDYLKTSNAWDWLRKQLEPCFLAVYDI